MHHRDDGTFSGGLIAAFAILFAFAAGYALRDSGFQLQIKQPVQQEVRQP